MSKKKIQHLLVAGADSWELWAGDQCVQTYEVKKASEISKAIPSPFIFAFSVREATALPFVAPTADEELLEELTEMHYERNGVTPDEAAGKLDDHFVISSDEQSSRVLALVLRVQSEHSMPRQAPSNFEVSARLFRPNGNCVALWRELGHWVFGFYDAGELVYFQALHEVQLGATVAREILMAEAQLQMQGLVSEENAVLLWDTTVAAREFEQAIGRPVSQEPKPAPMIPKRLSALLPADVAAERRRLRKRLQFIALSVIFVVALIATGLYLGEDYFAGRKKLAELKQEIELAAPDAELARQVLGKSEELKAMTENEMWPQQILLQCATCLPPGRKVRFKKFEVMSGPDGRPVQVEINGQARDEDFAAIGQFQTLLQRNRRIRAAYTFEEIKKEQDRQKDWNFTWTLTLKSADPSL